MKPYYLSRLAKVAFETPETHSHFCGYYTTSPVSADGRYLLAHRADFDGRPVSKEDRIEVGCFDLETGVWRELGVSRAFNWQQGALLQWLGPDYRSRVIFNDQEGDHFVARVVEMNSGRTTTLPQAIYTPHPSGEFAIGVRFERHYFCRAYHYEGINDKKWKVPIHPEDSILFVDLKGQGERLIIRTAEIAELDPTKEMQGKAHWLEHLLWNPSGTRFAFLHRFGDPTGFKTRLFTADPDGGNLYQLPDYKTYIYTHMAWRNDAEYVVYAKRIKGLAKAYAGIINDPHPFKASLVKGLRLIKKVLPKGYVHRKREEGGYAHVLDGVGRQNLLSKSRLHEDGHPNWSRDGRFMLSDTYADEKGYRHLYLYDHKLAKIHDFGRFFSQYNNCGYRCDLHPRFSRDEACAIIDTAHNQSRKIFMVEIDWPAIGRCV